MAVTLITGSLMALYCVPRLTSSPARTVEVTPASPGMVGLLTPSTAPPTTAAPPTTTAPPTTIAPPSTTPAPTAPTAPAPPPMPAPPRPTLPANAPAWVADHVEPGDTIIGFASIDDSRGILTVMPMSVQGRCRNPLSFAIGVGKGRLALGGWANPHPAGRWYVAPAFEECALSAYNIYDAATESIKSVPAHGGFTGYLTSNARFTTRDDDSFWIYDLPSVTYQRIWVPDHMRAVLNQFEPDRAGPAWSNGRIVELPEGLVAHIQCFAASCARDTSVIGWFFVGDDNVIDPDRPLPKPKWPPLEFFCSA